MANRRIEGIARSAAVIARTRARHAPDVAEHALDPPEATTREDRGFQSGGFVGGLVSRRIIALRGPPKDTGCLLAGRIRRPRGTVATDGVSALSALCGTIKEHVGHGVAALPTRPKAHHRSIPNLGIWWYRPNVLQTNPLTQDASATYLGNR